MALDGKDFISYQLFVKKFLADYNQKLCSGLRNLGYLTNYEGNFIYLIGKKKEKVISLPLKCKKISYGNIMDYDLFPYEREKRNTAEAKSKLEKIIDKICDEEIAEFAFQNGLSLNLWSDERFKLIDNDSIFIPIKAVLNYNCEDIIQKISLAVNPKKSLISKAKDLFKEYPENVASSQQDYTYLC